VAGRRIEMKSKIERDEYKSQVWPDVVVDDAAEPLEEARVPDVGWDDWTQGDLIKPHYSPVRAIPSED